MKTQKIPKLVFSAKTNIEDKIQLVKKDGAKLPIETVNWKEFPKTLPVSVRVAHNDDAICLFYEVKGEQLRAVNTEDFGSVWEDSCVEFFVQREGEKQYRNFECNALGVLLASVRTSRDDAENLTSEQMASVVRRSSITHYYKDDMQLSDWTLYLEIPKTLFGFAHNESLSHQSCKANFYKCGDETPEPHFISWNPIKIDAPDFHRPDFFGTLQFE